jgi:hypothetical protein
MGAVVFDGDAAGEFEADFFDTTRTSGFGVSGGESDVALAGEYFSFQ